MISVLAALALAGGSASAQGILAYSAGVPETATNWSRVVELPGFDPSLGTLTAVKLNYTLDVWQSLGLENLGSSPASYAASTTAALSLGGPGAAAYPVQRRIIFSRSGSLGPSDGNLDETNASRVSFGRHYVLMPNTISIPPALFGAFESSGDLGFPATATASSALLADANLDFRALDSAALTLNVTYDFTPIPEPGPFALLAGLVALCAAITHRRGRRQRAT